MSWLVSPRLWDTRGACSTALLPLSALYACGVRAFEALSSIPRRAPVPVVCAGTALVGGASKTPVALAIGERLSHLQPSLEVHFLTRGYGGSVRGPLCVDPAHLSSVVGDEALLLAGARTTWVSADRLAGAIAASAAGASLVVMDDGLQHHTIGRDLSLLCKEPFD
jgi:tetraacyldisaccharide 4'-kinase